MCTALSVIATGMLSLSLNGSEARFLPIAAMVVLGAIPFVAAGLSGRASAVAAGAGGLALGVTATVIAAALHQGGTGALPFTVGGAVSAAVALSGPKRVIPARAVAIVVLIVYAIASERLISGVFVYPLLGIADEIADAFAGRGAKPKEPVPT